MKIAEFNSRETKLVYINRYNAYKMGLEINKKHDNYKTKLFQAFFFKKINIQ